MLQLLELIANSPIGAFLASALRNTYYAAMILSDCVECGFQDLGRLLFGGIILTVLMGVGASFWWWRRKESHPSAAQFVSIRANDRRH